MKTKFFGETDTISFETKVTPSDRAITLSGRHPGDLKLTRSSRSLKIVSFSGSVVLYPCQIHDSPWQNQKGSLLDATIEGEHRRDVFIKRVDTTTHPDEVKIASRLGSLESCKDPKNHCIPVLDVFPDKQDARYQYIVMPVLRPFNEPNFTSFGEVVDFVDQTLEVASLLFCTHSSF